MEQRERIGRIGIWSGAWSGAQDGDGSGYTAVHDEAIAEVEELGFGAVWMGNNPAATYAMPLLRATSRITVATGILSIWEHEAADVAAQRAAVERAHPGRFLLGVGVSHHVLTERYERPYSAMVRFLDGLDTAAEPVPAGARVLAALGPRMLELARDRSAGAHPYLVTADHTRQARERLGPEPLLAPEFKVVLDPDRDRAKETARNFLAKYLEMPNYTSNLLKFGFAEEDMAGGGSDRLLDAVFAFGDEEAAVRRAEEHFAAGADHVAVQAVTPGGSRVLTLPEWRRLAAALIKD